MNSWIQRGESSGVAQHAAAQRRIGVVAQGILATTSRRDPGGFGAE
jgi:hypothetical protein